MNPFIFWASSSQHVRDSTTRKLRNDEATSSHSLHGDLTFRLYPSPSSCWKHGTVQGRYVHHRGNRTRSLFASRRDGHVVWLCWVYANRCAISEDDSRQPRASGSSHTGCPDTDSSISVIDANKLASPSCRRRSGLSEYRSQGLPLPGNGMYGKTKNGRYMTEQLGIASGARADHNKPCSAR